MPHNSILLQKKLFYKTKESLSSVLPITLIVLMLNFTVTPMPFSIRGLFLIGSFLLIIGMGLFTLGADMAMLPMGEHMGSHLTKSRKFLLMLATALIMGTMVTFAEPDLQVLAELTPGIPNMTLVLTVAVGVGVFLMIAVLRILFQWRLSYLLIGLYLAVFVIGAFVPAEYLAVAYDSGGVTTGPITVPFILAFGIGISSVRGGKSSHDDSFGLVAMCSVGPIMAVLILGIFFDSGAAASEAQSFAEASNVRELFHLFRGALPFYFREVAGALAPIVIFFLLFQLIALRLPVTKLIRMGIGIAYTFFGLVLFLTGVNVGFLPAGTYIGEYMGSLSWSWALIPLGIVMGYFVVAAEPAVHVLNEQVEDITGGAISKDAMLLALSSGVAISVGLAMCRIVFDVSLLYFLIPGYGIALALTFFVPKIFSAVAFDSGGVASGAMTATFLLPFALGACRSSGGDMMRDAFGIVALIAMTPLVTIQVMGLVYKFKVRVTEDEETEALGGVIDFEEDYLDWDVEEDYVDWDVSPGDGGSGNRDV
ncbi:MAG: DUF1538 domain-containing protein [Clostridiales Family XIII bacterium]|nr:DUF1538 domain-containing protein [Clostridiales Family XIII bacterium]